MSHHPTKRLRAPDGSRADIDVLLVPLIEALWAAGYETVTCCQDLGESITIPAAQRQSAHWKGYAMLEMPWEDTIRLLNAVQGTDQFRDHMHWASEGAWSTSISVTPNRGRTDIAPWAQIRFPASQIGDLVDVVREMG